MGIIARLEAGKMADRFRAAAQQGSAAFTPMSSEFINWLANPSKSGKAVNEQTVMAIAAAWACRRIICESIGMLPYSMFEKDSEGNAEKADDHPLQDVLVYSPNREQTTVEFRESLGMGLTGAGNAYSFIDRLGKRTSSLMPIVAQVEPMRKIGSNTKLNVMDGEVFFRVNDRGQPTDFPREKIWHLKGFGSDPLKGLSPIMAAKEAMGGALAQEEFANRFFTQGGMMGGTVTYPGWLKQDQREAARESLQRLVGGLGGAHQFALFEGGVKPEPWATANLEEMQFIVARRFSVLEVCRFYRVPPHMVAELEKGASYASIEQMSMEFVMFTLMPYLTRIEASVTKWLLPIEERRKFMLRFNYEGLLRADSKGRAEMYASALQNGWMHRDEVRGKENLNRIGSKGMQAFTAQTSLTTIDKIGEEPKPEKMPERAPATTENRVQVLNVMPERSLMVEGPKVEIQPAQVHAHHHAGDVHSNTPVNVTGHEQLAAVLGKLGDLVDGMRQSQERNQALATELLRKEG